VVVMAIEEFERSKARYAVVRADASRNHESKG
jgi:hypothetical protein